MSMRVTLLNADELKQYPPEKIIGEFAAVCYDTDIENVAPEKIAKHCIESGHGTPQRAVKFIFHIEGVSRAFSHQFVRHNIGVTHNQRSQRFCRESDFPYVVPISIAYSSCEQEYCELMDQIGQLYTKMINCKIPAEDARFILPNACETQLNSAFDYQALVHFCHERLCSRSQWEIRQVAQAMVEEVKKVSPFLAQHLVPKCEADGYCREGKKCCGRKPTKEYVLEIFNKVTKGQ